MRKNLTKKLFLSVLTLAFAVISLGASTYAWFILSEDASVQPFSGTVSAGESGLEIAVAEIADLNEEQFAALKWRSTELNIVEDFKNYMKKDDLGNLEFRFDALQNNVNNTKFDANAFTKNEYVKDAEGNPTTELVKGSLNVNYIGFRLYFRLSDTTGVGTGSETVYLTDYDLETESAAEWYVNKNYEGVTGPVNVGQTGVKYYVSDAARIAFVAGGNATVYETETSELAGDPNFASQGIGSKGALSYYNNVTGAGLQCPTADKYYESVKSLDTALALGQLTATANQTYVDVYVWIDGWDQECINAIFAQQLNIALKFSLNNTLQEEDA